MSLGGLADFVGTREAGPFLEDGQQAHCVAGTVDSGAREAVKKALKGSMTGYQLNTAPATAAQAFKVPCNATDSQRRLASGVMPFSP